MGNCPPLLTLLRLTPPASLTPLLTTFCCLPAGAAVPQKSWRGDN